MNRRSPSLTLSTALMCGVLALSVTGIPHLHDADHPADVAHVERGHGGHGAVLPDQDERLPSKTLDFSAATAAVTPALTEPVTTGESFGRFSNFTHPGRDPPEESRPRAPPILIS